MARGGFQTPNHFLLHYFPSVGDPELTEIVRSLSATSKGSKRKPTRLRIPSNPE